MNLQTGIREQDARHLRELLPRARLQGEAIGVKENIRHVYDEAASRVASLQNAVELLLQPLPKLFLLLLGLLGVLLRRLCLLLRLLGLLFRGQALRFGLLLSG